MKQVATTSFTELQQEAVLNTLKKAEPTKPIEGFRYSGYDSLRRKISGVVPFTDSEEAQIRLARAGIEVNKLEPIVDIPIISSIIKRKRNGKPNTIEMAFLADQFASQYAAGIPYDRICQILARVHPNDAVKAALLDTAHRIMDGEPPHDAFEAQLDKRGRAFFPMPFVYAFKIGYEVGAIPDPENEEGNSLDAPVVMLKFFAQSQRRAAEIFKKFQGEMIYPVGIIVSIIIAFFVEVYWIVPIFAELFKGLVGSGKDASLPWTTQIMLDISSFFRSPVGWVATLAFFASLFSSIYYLFFNKKGIDWRERTILKVPIFKEFFVRYYGASFCRNLSMLWASESDIAKRFEIVAATSVNPVFREMAEHIANHLRTQSTPISELFTGYSHLLGDSFAPVAETIAIADGQKSLYIYAKQLESEAEEKMDRLIGILGKAVFIISAGLVLFLLVASYSPMLEMINKLSKH